MSAKSKAQLKADIDANIKTNGNKEITGAILNSELTDFIDSFATNSSNGLAQILNNSNETFGNNIVITNGDVIVSPSAEAYIEVKGCPGVPFDVAPSLYFYTGSGVYSSILQMNQYSVEITSNRDGTYAMLQLEDTFNIKGNSNYYAKLSTNSLSTDRNIIIQDLDGTLALTASTLSGYSITDAYTSTEVDTIITELTPVFELYTNVTYTGTTITGLTNRDLITNIPISEWNGQILEGGPLSITFNGEFGPESENVYISGVNWLDNTYVEVKLINELNEFQLTAYEFSSNTFPETTTFIHNLNTYYPRIERLIRTTVDGQPIFRRPAVWGTDFTYGEVLQFEWEKNSITLNRLGYGNFPLPYAAYGKWFISK